MRGIQCPPLSTTNVAPINYDIDFTLYGPLKQDDWGISTLTHVRNTETVGHRLVAMLRPNQQQTAWFSNHLNNNTTVKYMTVFVVDVIRNLHRHTRHGETLDTKTNLSNLKTSEIKTVTRNKVVQNLMKEYDDTCMLVVAVYSLDGGLYHKGLVCVQHATNTQQTRVLYYAINEISVDDRTNIRSITPFTEYNKFEAEMKAVIEAYRIDGDWKQLQSTPFFDIFNNRMLITNGGLLYGVDV